MNVRLISLLLVLCSAAGSLGLAAGEPRLEGFDYPFPVKEHRFTSQQQELEMSYMDVPAAAGSADGAVLLLHGKNFSGAYWKETADALSRAGYRVIMPDQVGFGKSSKPAAYQFTFQQLAANTHQLVAKLGLPKVHVVGHSMGGMIATRYALMFPQETESLTLENPLGLEDWKAKGVPYTTLDAAYRQEREQTLDKIRAYQLDNYYDGKWRADYDRWVDMLAQFLQSPDYPRMAWDQALTSDMIFTQPVCYEFGKLSMPVLLIIGQRDRTAIGKKSVPGEVAKALGNYSALGRQTAAVIPQSKLVEIDSVGHLPHIEDFPHFIEPLKTFLRKPAAELKNERKMPASE